MGYYTRYNLEVEVPPLTAEEAKSNIEKDLTYDVFDDTCKWYSHDEDMLAFSLKNPTVLFKLTGEGEESGDLWVKYFRNGKMQIAKAKIAYESFDESKMK